MPHSSCPHWHSRLSETDRLPRFGDSDPEPEHLTRFPRCRPPQVSPNPNSQATTQDSRVAPGAPQQAPLSHSASFASEPSFLYDHHLANRNL